MSRSGLRQRSEEQATGVAADVVDGVEAAAVAVQHDLPALGLDGGRRVVRQAGLLQRAGPPTRSDGPRHPVDHHTFGEYEMTAEVTGRGRDREAGRAQSACRATVAGHPGAQGGTLQAKGHRVEEAVEEPDAAVLIVADGPVAQTGQGGSARGEDAGRAKHACGVDSAPGSWVAVRSVQYHDARPQPDGQVAECWVQRVADPSAAMQQLKGKIVLVPFADWPEYGGQPVAQSPEPAKLVEPGSEVAMPSDQPGGSERGADSRPGRLAGCWRIVGLVAAGSHEVPPRWRQLVTRS